MLVYQAEFNRCVITIFTALFLDFFVPTLSAILRAKCSTLAPTNVKPSINSCRHQLDLLHTKLNSEL